MLTRSSSIHALPIAAPLKRASQLRHAHPARRGTASFRAQGRCSRLGGNHRAAWRPPAPFCRRAARPCRRRPAQALGLGEPERAQLRALIGTAMLSYGEHGKFSAPAQGRPPQKHGETRYLPRRTGLPRSAGKVDHGSGAGAMEAKVLSAAVCRIGDIEHHRLRQRRAGFLGDEVVLAALEPRGRQRRLAVAAPEQ